MAESELPKLTPKLLAEFNPHPPVDAGALRRATLTLDLSALRHNAVRQSVVLPWVDAV